MEHFQIYLTRRVQQYFGIPTQNVKPDKDVKLTKNWHRLWRIDHLTCNAGKTQHLFLATNAASLFSFIIPLFDDESFDRLISLFYQHWFDMVLANGMLPPIPAATKTDYLRGRPNSLIGSMNMIVDHALTKIHDKKATVKQTHQSIRNMPMRQNGQWIYPSEEFAQLLKTDPPYLPAPAGDSHFPFAN